MPDKEPQFTVTDRRKFTLDGELRPGVVASEAPKAEAPAASGATPAPPVAASIPPAQAVAPGASQSAGGGAAVAEADEFGGQPFGTQEELQLPEPTAREAAEQHAAYQESAKGLDELIARQNPRAKAPGEMTFDRLVQSIYMTAAIQLGAGGQPGEQPRVDILGARQSIDMLTVLAEKTKGNLTPSEERLLQNAVFELRMSFLEITNAIAASAAQGPPPPAAKSGFFGGKR